MKKLSLFILFIYILLLSFIVTSCMSNENVVTYNYKLILWVLLIFITSIAAYFGIKWQSDVKEDIGITCDSCGSDNDNDANFCKICGEKIRN